MTPGWIVIFSFLGLLLPVLGGLATLWLKQRGERRHERTEDTRAAVVAGIEEAKERRIDATAERKAAVDKQSVRDERFLASSQELLDRLEVNAQTSTKRAEKAEDRFYNLQEKFDETVDRLKVTVADLLEKLDNLREVVRVYRECSETCHPQHVLSCPLGRMSVEKATGTKPDADVKPTAGAPAPKPKGVKP